MHLFTIPSPALICIFLVSLVLSVESQQVQKRPHIIYILADDLVCTVTYILFVIKQKL